MHIQVELCSRKHKNAFKEGGFKITYSTKKLQHENSLLRGLFCVSQILCNEIGIDNKSFTSFFSSTNLEDNDEICIAIIK